MTFALPTTVPPTPTPSISVADTTTPGDLLAGRYELGEVIGEGGMGMVCRAIDRSLDREVAVKLLKPGVPADSPAAARFVAEAKVTGQLQHPGIPAVHELGTLPDGRPFLAMKLVKGRTLQELLKERPNPGATGAASSPSSSRSVMPSAMPMPTGDPPRFEAGQRHGRCTSAKCR